MTTNKISWQPPSKIPTVAELISSSLNSSKLQLLILKQENNPLLNKKAIQSIIESCEDHNELLPACLQQCQRWQANKLNDKQLATVNEIIDDITSLVKINQELFDLAMSIKNNWFKAPVSAQIIPFASPDIN